MHVFVTGASGFIGSAVLQELLSAGHTVTGLVRSDSAAAALEAKGAKASRGSLEDIDSIKRGASESDGVIHLAFNHDFTKFVENAQAERVAIEALGEVLAGSNRPLICASGTMMLPRGVLGTEYMGPESTSFPNPRAGNEELLVSLASKGVRSAAIRLSPTVHGEDDHGFIYRITQMARAKGVSAYVGDGLNHWPAVHRFDAARLFRLALEKGEAGARYHAVDEEGVPFKDIAEAIGKSLGVPTVSKTGEEVSAHFAGFMAHVVGADNRASSKKTQEQLGWTPTGPKLLADIEAGVYTKDDGSSALRV